MASMALNHSKAKFMSYTHQKPRFYIMSIGAVSLFFRMCIVGILNLNYKSVYYFLDLFLHSKAYPKKVKMAIITQ